MRTILEIRYVAPDDVRETANGLKTDQEHGFKPNVLHIAWIHDRIKADEVLLEQWFADAGRGGIHKGETAPQILKVTHNWGALQTLKLTVQATDIIAILESGTYLDTHDLNHKTCKAHECAL